MSKCGSCGSFNQGEWRFCPNCGGKNQPPSCTGCGAQQTSPDWKFCSTCGSKNGAAFQSSGAQGFGVNTTTRPDTRESTQYSKVDLSQRKIGGLDDDLAAKRNATYDHGLEQACRVWLQQKTGTPITGDFHTFLKDGVFLCNLALALKPGSVAQPKKSSMPFVQMENINKFLSFCSQSGVANLSLFQTVDLFENKNMGQVVLCLSALSRIYP